MASFGGAGWTVAAESDSTIPLGSSCTTTECHADIDQHRFLHGPMNLGQCAPCHEPIENKHEFKAVSASICTACHEIKADKPFVHKPFAEDCLNCHSPHGEENRFFVKGGTGAKGCYRCHTDHREQMAVLHGPVAMGECLVCHLPHQSDNAKLLTDPKEQLCQACHVEIQARLDGAVSVHEPFKGDCVGCHDPHGGQIQFMLRAKGRNLCQTCHADFIDRNGRFKFPHAPMIEGKACQNCHLPHTSDQEHLLKDKTMPLCFSCHDQDIKTDHRVVANIADVVENASFLHGPLRQGNCVACHQVHGSDHENLLERAFPSTFYASFREDEYAFCFHCHDKTLITEKQSSLTGFRNGERNLHFLHVNRKKGRTCRACHSPHATDQAKHIREEVPFGRWQMEVHYETTPTGGSCLAGCHALYRYDRVEPFDNSRGPKQ